MWMRYLVCIFISIKKPSSVVSVQCFVNNITKQHLVWYSVVIKYIIGFRRVHTRFPSRKYFILVHNFFTQMLFSNPNINTYWHCPLHPYAIFTPYHTSEDHRPATGTERRRRGALVADEKTKEDMRMAVENVALAVTSAVRIKKKAASFSKKISPKEDIELSPEEEGGKRIACHEHCCCEMVWPKYKNILINYYWVVLKTLFS